MEGEQPQQKVVMSENYIAHGDLLEKINPDAIVEVFKRRFMGQEFINGVWVTNKHLKDKALTEKGAYELATLMLSASSQNVSISKLNDREIRERTKSLIKTAMKMCIRNWEEYGIKGTDRFFFIKDVIHTNTFVSLKQPEGAGIQKLIGGTHDVKLSESETKQPNIWDKVLRA